MVEQMVKSLRGGSSHCEVWTGQFGLVHSVRLISSLVEVNQAIISLDKYRKCRNCEGYEYFNCANKHENQRKEICLNGLKE